ncbi:5'-methylthioadenosine/S-adenosylhomocysteine nucleosidase [Schaalia sp. 19OD2882]|nr:5'-methylthioadenosine/S-adenosylhomocysteine nucleosidase [Schaalia sp. 19OD2882]
MAEEAAPVLALMDQDGRSELTSGSAGAHLQSFVLGSIDGAPVLVVTGGIGLANAASATARALTLVDPQIVVAAGTTGGLHVDVEVGDVAAGTTSIYSGVDATAFGYARGQVPRMPVDYSASPRALEALEVLPARIDHPVRRGRIVSADSFVTAANVAPVRQEFPDAVATDMETCAMAQVCWSSGVDWISMRAVSDLCGPRADQDFHMDSDRAAQHSADAVREFLRLY